MNPNFTFPQPQPARTRPVVEIVGASPTSRESNALRASVLETALLLGVGSSNTVTDWMFNPLQEEEDEEVSGSIHKLSISNCLTVTR
jgi:hypothetical protein